MWTYHGFEVRWQVRTTFDSCRRTANAINLSPQCGQRPLHGSVHSKPISPSTLSHRYTLASRPSSATVRSLSNRSIPSQGASPLQPSVATLSPRSDPRALPQCISLILNLDVSQPPGTPLYDVHCVMPHACSTLCISKSRKVMFRA
jgi:hypothetical protein